MVNEESVAEGVGRGEETVEVVVGCVEKKVSEGHWRNVTMPNIVCSTSTNELPCGLLSLHWVTGK